MTSVQWLPQMEVDPTLRHTLLLSTALDGKIFLWAVDSKTQTMAPRRAFLVQADHLPRTLKVRGRSRAEVGVTAVSVNSEDPNIVSIGTEAGAVFQVHGKKRENLSGLLKTTIALLLRICSS